MNENSYFSMDIFFNCTSTPDTIILPASLFLENYPNLYIKFYL